MAIQRYLVAIHFAHGTTDAGSSFWIRILEKLNHETGSNNTVLCCQIQARLQDQQQLCCAVKEKIWYPVDQIEIDKPLFDENDEKQEVSVAERLHEVADNLPFTGCILDVIIELTDEIIGSDSYLTLWGALRRLKDWHNAAITMVTQNDINHIDDIATANFSVKKLRKFLGANIVNSVQDIEYDRHLNWRGKVSVVDKTVNKGFILPGFKIHSDKDDNFQEIDFSYPCHQMSTDDVAVLGRMLEVLDEVNVYSVPSFMFTTKTYYLSLYQQHPHSVSLIDHIGCNDRTGVLMRLICYPQTLNIPLCEDKYLNTSSWKESVMADITYVQEPEEELLESFEYLYFLVTNSSSNRETDRLIVHQLRSPYELDGSIIYHLYHHSILPSKEDCNEGEIIKILSDLPEFCDAVLQQIHQDLEDIQFKLMQEWLDKQEMTGQKTVVKLSDIYRFLAEIQDIFMENVMQHLPKTQLDTEVVEMPKRQRDLDVNPADWPERKYLVYQESQKRALSRLQSTESMALSSPIQPNERTKATIDVHDFLKLFKSDGTAALENLSPVRKRHPSRSQARIVDQDQEDVARSSWPDSFDLCRYPDVYYNRGKKREKFEAHFNKLRDRYVTAETYSSCSSPKVVFPNKIKSSQSNKKLTGTPKKKKSSLLSPRRSPRKSVSNAAVLSPRRSPRKAVSMMPPRRSPRKKASRQFLSGDYTNVVRKDTKVSDSVQLPIPKHLLADGDSKRRHSLSSVPTDKTRSVKDKADPRRMSASGLQNDPKRKTSVDSSDLDDSLSKRVSRSERHKRKLEEICADVLLAKGVDKDNPIYSSCASRLYKVTKLYVMDLPTSRNLKDEMKKIATDQVQHVIDVETRRQNTAVDSGNPSKRQRRT